MKAYKDLTETGKKRRLTTLVKKALEQYDIEYTSLRYYTEETNIFYRFNDADGKNLTMKIFCDESTTLEDNYAEVFFLDAVAKNSDLVIPKVIRNKSGEPITIIDWELMDGTKRIAVYEWVSGKQLANCITMELLYNLGAAAASLHKATENIELAQNIRMKQWNKVFYFDADEIVYKDEKYKKYVDDNFYKVMDFIIPYLDEHLNGYYNGAKLQLIHGDLNPWNVLVSKDKLRLIDFEDGIWGIPLHDIAIMLFYFRDSEKYNYNEVKDNILSGYESVKPLPEITDFDIELHIAARQVNFLNYVLLLEDEPEEYCAEYIKVVERFIDNYAKDDYEKHLNTL